MNRRQDTVTSASGWLDRLFGLDLRTLAVTRIAVALVLLGNLATRAVDLRAMYTDAGIAPRQVVLDYYQQAGAWRWSLHLLGGSVEFQALLLVVAAGFALALLAGFWTRLATLGSWVLLVSLHTRMPLLVTGGDVLLGMLLFWGLLLPLGEVWSVDAWRRRLRAERSRAPERSRTPERLRTPERSRTLGASGGTGGQVLSAASVAILLQVGLMYLLTGWGKCNSYWFSGEAIYNALSYAMIARPLGRQLLEFPELLRWLTWGTLALELAAPLLLFCPLATLRVRGLTVLALIGLHVAIELTMRVTLFSFASLAGLTLFVPGTFWQGCLDWCRIRWAGRRWAASGAGAEAASCGGLAQPDAATKAGAWNWLREAAVLLLLGYVLVYNVGWQLLGERFLLALPAGLHRVGDVLMIGQRWTMFVAPDPTDYRLAAVARLRDGQVVDVLRDGAAVDFAAARQWSAELPSQRWMLLFRELADDRNSWFRQATAEYFYRQWNAGQPAERRIELLDLLIVQVRPWIDSPAGPAMVRLAQVDSLQQGPHRGGLRHGAWVLLHPDGRVASRGDYRDGKREGPWEFYHENGQLAARGEFRADRQSGPWTHWLPDGRKEGEGHYLDGRLHGRWRFWYEDGRELELEYDRDRPLGEGSLGEGPRQSGEQTTMAIMITSPAFAAGQPIPARHTGDGQDVSPPLEWTGLPDQTRQLALICDDPDAPTPQPWVHWVLYGLSPQVRSLAEGIDPAPELKQPPGARQGKNSWSSGRTIGYRGPAPPPGHGTHHYHFKLYALDAELDLPAGLDKATLLKRIEGHILAQGELVGTYER
ncbi:MAG: YbhB/YbcL family Raf kinase inhibitor-like protein [Pirellulaceae bacterium]|nr:YbhB/YbcL family Raf kinase inhibitor-like protein [Pirellulaceae bacterium]